MAWSTLFPNGNLSVKANEALGQGNTTYIEETMGDDVVGTNTVTTRDHFWDVDPNLDGRHRFIQSPAFTEGGIPANPVVGTGMDGVNYLKTTNGSAQNFYRTSGGVIYQTSPNVLKGSVPLTINVTSDVVAVPDNCYGEIFMWADISSIRLIQKGIFSSSVTCFQSGLANGTSTNQGANNIQFLSAASSLYIRAKPIFTGTWHYIVTYRAVDF